MPSTTLSKKTKCGERERGERERERERERKKKKNNNNDLKRFTRTKASHYTALLNLYRTVR